MVLCSWVAFWIVKTDVPGRCGLGITTVLSVAKIGFVGGAGKPMVPYATALDIFVIICFISVFASIVEVLICCSQWQILGYAIYILIQSVDIQSRRAGSDHCFNACCCSSVHPSVRTHERPTFQNLGRQNKFQVKTMFYTGETVGLTEWIIDDTCLI